MVCVAALVAAQLVAGRARAQCDAPAKQLFGMNIDPPNPAGNPSVAELQAAGVRWVRIEYKHGAGFGVYDPIIAALHAGGIRVMLLVDYASVASAKPRSDTGASGWSGYRSDFLAAVSAVADHYGDQIDAWEIWNEPDLFFPGTGYDPGIPASVYGPMLVEVGAAVRARSSGRLVVGGLASGDVGYLTSTISAAGGSLSYDAVGVHPYGQRSPDGWPSTSWGFGDMSAFYDRYWAAAGLPLWLTEIGTNDSSVQADYVTHVYQQARDSYLTHVPVIFWFCWSDGMVSPFGLRDAGGGAKASYTSYATIAPDFEPSCAGGSTDADSDGYSFPADCDDTDPAIHPGATDVCGNGVDEDCSGADTACPPTATARISFDPAGPAPGATVTATVLYDDGLTNVVLEVTGPGGERPTTWMGVDMVGADYRWRWSFDTPDAGTYVVRFLADPAGTLYGETSLTLTSGTTPGTDAGVGPGTDAGTTPGTDAGATPGTDGGVAPGADGGGAGDAGGLGGGCSAGGRGDAPAPLVLGLAALLLGLGRRRRRPGIRTCGDRLLSFHARRR